MLELSDKLKATYPGAGVGILEMRGVANPASNGAIEDRANAVEKAVRERHPGADRAAIKAIPAIRAYNEYYKRFKKTYHVQLQLESVILKNRPIPGMRALVKAMVTAELENQLLTAGHDVAALDGALVADVASGEEMYTRFGGQEQQLKQNDMFIADNTGIISSIIYGPDARTAIGADTEHVCFTVYGVQGIAPDSVEAHLRDIRDGVMLVSPDAEVVELRVCG